MKIIAEPQEGGTLTVTECFSGLLMRTSEGNQIGICMRDDTFEINVMPKGEHTGNWWRVNMETGEFEKEQSNPAPVENPDGACTANSRGSGAGRVGSAKVEKDDE